jgi:diguanylate cyclase (GGDEF)-like protein
MPWTDSTFTPVVVLIEGQEWTARSLESILTPHGCAVFRAYTGKQGLDVLKRVNADLILVDRHLSDMTGPQVFKRLQHLPTVADSTPKCLISASPLSRDDRMAAFEEGAWEVLTPPFDATEITVRVNTWVQCKREVDKARERGMVDPLTGLYNLNGLLRRIDEVVSDASRNERHVSLVAVGLPPDESSDDDARADEVTQLVGTALGSTTRVSDTVARVGPSEFVIVAPGTDSSGAKTLVGRLLELAGTEEVPLRAGIFSSRRSKREPVTSLDLLNRATEALRRAQSSQEGPFVFSETTMN